MTNNDELERQKFEAWFLKEFPRLNVHIGKYNDVALFAKSTAWAAWQARAKQASGGNDWIDWEGGKCPVADDTAVAVKYRNGVVMPDQPADCYEWNHGYGDMAKTRVDIIAYRVVRPDQARAKAGEQS